MEWDAKTVAACLLGNWISRVSWFIWSKKWLTHLVYKVFDYRLAAWLDFLYYYYYTINYDDDLVSHAFGRVAPRCYRLESILFPVNTYHYHGGWNLCHVCIVDVPNENPDDTILMDTLSILLIQTPQLHTHNRLSKNSKTQSWWSHCNESFLTISSAM